MSSGRPMRRTRVRTSSTPASIWLRSVTSTVTAIPDAPDAAILAAVSSAALPSRSKIATAAPSLASRSLIAKPIPEPPPVTIAVRPLLRSAPDAVDEQVPELVRRIAAAGVAGYATDRRREGVEHDDFEHHAGDPSVVQVPAHGARSDGVVEHLVEERDERRERPGGLRGVGGHQLLGELGERDRRL